MVRIAPLAPPYEADVGQALRKWMPPGVREEPLALFRVLQHHRELASRMRVLGAGLLAHGELPALDREIVIARVTARCGCRYEWGVHATVFAPAVGLTPEQLEATVSGDSRHPAWPERHRALIAAVDELHDTATVSDAAWAALAEHYPASQLLEFLVLAGWYRTIAYVAGGVGLDEEPWAAPYPGG
ncbi:carboxymuconolactone decarboxylase [Amycolatopsis sp. WAC 04169]|uniref:carboxymuconolactone decarboxylase family protein n=1 Tax=Amycolatopsis sp. WAC 04169 TaxID=2203197 RepID=UPI000F77F714|nr:carboxymuconolactone decarboxylase family protein [Amycolatopsis sp. WAC 04169]RSN29211.1 carboxymuconolactone decarboxylase [Amycolatopsis sp. WAC 04169]